MFVIVIEFLGFCFVDGISFFLSFFLLNKFGISRYQRTLEEIFFFLEKKYKCIVDCTLNFIILVFFPSFRLFSITNTILSFT